MRRDSVIALSLFGLALWHFLAQVDNPDRFHRDEARWIHRSYFIRELFQPDSPTWSGDSVLTLGQPPLGSYLMGIGLLLQGRELAPNGFYNFNKGPEWNEEAGNIPAEADLYAGRRTNAVVGALTVMLVYAIGRKLANRVAGVVGALILIPHPLNAYLSTFAGSDALLVFLVAAAALAAIFLAERPTWAKAILLGVLVGLGGATKLTPIALAFPLAALGVAILAHDLPRRLRTTSALATLAAPTAPHIPPWRRLLGTIDGEERALGWMLMTLPAVAAATFIAVYPYLWGDPIGNTRKLFDYRSNEMENQAGLYENTQVAGPMEAIERVRDQLGGRSTTSRWLSEQVEMRFDHAPQWPGADIKVGFLGLCLLAVWAMMYGPRSSHALVWIILVGQAALIILLMQVDFNRYHLPILLTLAVGIGFLAGQVWNVISAVGRGYESWRSRGAQSPHPILPAAAVALPLGSGPTGPPASRISSPTDTSRRPSWGSVGLLAVENHSAATERRGPVVLAAALGLGLVLGRAWLRLRTATRRGRAPA